MVISRIEIDAWGTEQALHHLTKKLSDASMVALMEGQFTDHLQNRARLRFFHHGDDASGDWEELSPWTFEIRRMGIGRPRGFIGGSTRTLNWTGAFREWIISRPSSVAVAGGVAQLKWPATQGSGGNYWKLRNAQYGISNHHIFGKPTGRSVPARPVAAVNEYDAKVLRGIMHEWIRRP